MGIKILRFIDSPSSSVTTIINRNLIIIAFNIIISKLQSVDGFEKNGVNRMHPNFYKLKFTALQNLPTLLKNGVFDILYPLLFDFYIKYEPYMYQQSPQPAS